MKRIRFGHWMVRQMRSLSIPLRMKHFPITKSINKVIYNFQFLWGWNPKKPNRGLRNMAIPFQFLWGWNFGIYIDDILTAIKLSIPLRMKRCRIWEGSNKVYLSIPLRMKRTSSFSLLNSSFAFSSFEDETWHRRPDLRGTRQLLLSIPLRMKRDPATQC